MKLPFVWMFHKGERPSWGQTVGRDRDPHHPFPDTLARSRRHEGSNHGVCPASSRSLLPAGQLKHSATHPCVHAHELRAASLHVAPHRKTTAIATAAPTRTTPHQQNSSVPQLRLRCVDSVADSVVYASALPSAPCPPRSAACKPPAPPGPLLRRHGAGTRARARLWTAVRGQDGPSQFPSHSPPFTRRPPKPGSLVLIRGEQLRSRYEQPRR